MRSAAMLLSVVVPVYNVARCIHRGYESLKTQTFNEFELIFVDDGSTDGGGLLCDELAASDGRIRVIHQKNSGAGGARNAGIEAARGEYIVFFDIDDALHPDAFLVISRHLVQYHPEIMIFGYNEIDSTVGYNIRFVFEPITIRSNHELRDAYVERLAGLGIPNGFVWNKVYSRSFLLSHSIRFENLKIQQDEVFNLLAYRYATRVSVIPDVLYDYFIYHKGNTRSQYIPERINIYRLVRDAFLELKDFWKLDDVRLDVYIYKRYIDSLIFNVNYNLFHRSNGMSYHHRIATLRELMQEDDTRRSLEHLGCMVSLRNKYIYALQHRSAMLYDVFRRMDVAIAVLKKGVRKIIR